MNMRRNRISHNAVLVVSSLVLMLGSIGTALADSNQKMCIVVGLGASGAAPGCSGCGPDAPGGGGKAAKNVGEAGYEWNDLKPTPPGKTNKYGKVIKAPPSQWLPHEFHAVGASQVFPNCEEAEKWATKGAGSGFYAKVKYVLVVEIE